MSKSRRAIEFIFSDRAMRIVVVALMLLSMIASVLAWECVRASVLPLNPGRTEPAISSNVKPDSNTAASAAASAKFASKRNVIGGPKEWPVSQDVSVTCPHCLTQSDMATVYLGKAPQTVEQQCRNCGQSSEHSIVYQHRWQATCSCKATYEMSAQCLPGKKQTLTTSCHFCNPKEIPYECSH